MAQITISPGSWLNLTELLEFKGTLFWDLTEYPDIPTSDDDEIVQLTQQQAERLDLLASDKYGDPELLWVILLANDIELPNQLREGLILRIPAKATVDDILRPIE